MTPVLASLKAALAASYERRLLVIAGPETWGRSNAAAVATSWGGRWCWAGRDAPKGVVGLPPNRPGAALGQEWDGAVIDTWSGLRPDLLGALGGTVKGGGLLVLVTPAVAEWEHWRDPDYDRMATYPRQRGDLGCGFWQRLRRLLDDPAVITWEPSALPAMFSRVRSGASATPAAATTAAAVAAQLEVIAAVEHCGRGRAHRPLVITADRGRGKSAALGIAAARLLAAGRQILVTGPRPEGCETLFRHARQAMAEAGPTQPQRDGAEALTFLPVDELVQRARRGAFDPATVVLVDEAAGLATDVLLSLLRYPRVVFASTVHGYEGGGRGFELRFLPVVARLTPRWRRMTLTMPLRWSPTDPLERWLYRALLLDARPAVPAAFPVTEPFVIRQLHRTELSDETLLANLFGLLVQAHYRTAPDDLRQLLDDPGLIIWAAIAGSAVLGVLIATEEGALPADLHPAILAGRRRLRGHLLPQSLAAHMDAAPALAQRWWRVQRIAVVGEQQRQGLGRRLMAALEVAARARAIDSLGVSFAANADVLGFWSSVGLVPLRIGIKREVGSGGEALMLGRGLSADGQALVARLANQLWRQLPLALADYLRHWEPPLVVALFGAFGALGTEMLTAQANDRPAAAELALARRFAEGALGIESCLDPLARVSRWALMRRVELTPAAVTLLVSRLVQLRDWSETTLLAGATGRPQAERDLRAAITCLVAALEASAAQ